VFEGPSLPYTYRFILFALCMGIACGWKKKDDVPLDMNSFQKDKSLPIVLMTTQGVLDEKTGKIHVPARITLMQGGGKITADSMDYNTKTQRICAQGHVEMLHTNGTMAHCNAIELNLARNDGFMTMVRGLSPTRERISAKTMAHKGETTKLTIASYTPCELCTDQLHPMWSLHAREMVWDRAKARTKYTDAHFSVFGTPIFYIPSFSLPSKRASGIVSPDVGMNGQIGGYVGIPYFWAFHPKHDITLTPYLTTRGGPMVATEYRGRTMRHTTTIRGAINPFAPDFSSSSARIPDPNPWFTDREMPKTRGFAHGKTLININDFWRFSGEQWFVSDKTFLETRSLFGQNQATFLPSNATLERFGTQDYWRIRVLNYQGLRPQDMQKTIPLILPEISYDFTSQPLWQNSTLSFTGNILSLQRQEGTGMDRICGEVQWAWPGVTPWGQSLEGFMRGRVRLYGLSQGRQARSSNPEAIYMAPQMGVISRWPWMIHGLGTLSPIIQGIVSKNSSTTAPPNEDSQSLIFDESNLFSKNRFAGYDRSDYGSRINYGLDWSGDSAAGGIHAFIGQSYGLTKQNPLLETVGVRLGRSDYVGQVDLQSDYGAFIYRFRLDCQTAQARFQEFGWQGGPAWAMISGSYAFGKGAKTLENKEEVPANYNQIVVNVLSKIKERWMLKAFATYDFGETVRQLDGQLDGQLGNPLASWGQWEDPNQRLMDIGGGLGYQNECFSGEFSIQKSYYKAKEMQPGWTFSFSIQLKSIGGFT
jgi:LPS-assembly protein